MDKEEKTGSEEHRVDERGRELFKVTCADCGKETYVPFKPDGSRPVYCRDCFRQHREPRRY